MKRFALAIFVLVTGLAPSIAHAGNLQNLAGTSWKTLFRTSIQFGTNGKVSGFAGCNRFGGTYSQKGNHVRISRVFTTKMACPARQMSREFLMLRKLKEIRKFTGTREKIIFYDQRNRRSLTLLPKRK